MIRIGIVGIGRVGSTTAFLLSKLPCVDKLVLIDPETERAKGIAMDITDGTAFHYGPIAFAGGYSDIRDCDYVVVTAGTKPDTRPGATRLSGMKDAFKIVESIASGIKDSGFSGRIIIASNPLDTMTYAMWRLTGFPRHKVIGTGTSLDTARYITLLADRLGIGRETISGMVLGEHGDTSFPVFSKTTIDGENLFDYLERTKTNLSALDNIEDAVRKRGYEVARRLGSTYYGIASTIADLILKLESEEEKTLPIALVTERKDLFEVAISLPYSASKYGIRSIPIELTSEEERKLVFSAKAIRETIDMVF